MILIISFKQYLQCAMPKREIQIQNKLCAPTSKAFRDKIDLLIRFIDTTKRSDDITEDDKVVFEKFYYDQLEIAIIKHHKEIINNGYLASFSTVDNKFIDGRILNITKSDNEFLVVIGRDIDSLFDLEENAIQSQSIDFISVHNLKNLKKLVPLDNINK